VKRTTCLGWLASLLCVAHAAAHDLPVSYLDLRVGETGIDATLETSAKNLAREVGGRDAEVLLQQPETQRQEFLALAASRIRIDADGILLHPEVREITALPARRDLRLHLFYPFRRPPDQISVTFGFFSSDPRHQTFLNLYRGEALKHQDILRDAGVTHSYSLARQQSTLAVIRQFVREGVHHIFIGPDHILFVVGLLLLGGTIGQLCKIVTAFTVAHSLTLGLATLNLVTPPAHLIEPAIALSIVFVGAHAILFRAQSRDWRLLFAFGFGFIHGFGFANVLREMELPRDALGWSLFSFNLGVEIGQVCIVLAAAAALGLLARRSAPLARRVVTASSFGVVAAGAFWLTQRLQ